MGIKGLTKLLRTKTPEAFRERPISDYAGKRVAIDSSMHMYQFVTAVGNSLTNIDGEVTSHLNGMFYRMIRMLEAGVIPVYIFDGQAPDGKRNCLEERRGAKGSDHFFQQQQSSTRVQHGITLCKTMLELMGIEYVNAPSEAEAQAAIMCQTNEVDYVATEDTDALAFGSPVMLRQFSHGKKMTLEINLERVLKGLKLTKHQFVDFCILCGSDYAKTMKGIGPIRALQLIQEHGSIESIIKSIDLGKHPIPEKWNYEEARMLFFNPLVNNDIKISKQPWNSSMMREQELIDFLVNTNGFDRDRCQKAIKRIKKE